MPADTRTTKVIEIRPDLYRELEAVADVTGIPLEKAANDALDEWLSRTGMCILDLFDSRRNCPGAERDAGMDRLAGKSA